MHLVFDIETDGLLDTVTKVHCLVAINVDTNEVHVFEQEDVVHGLKMLNTADKIIGHNILGYDLKVLKKLYGFEPRAVVLDTLVISRVDYAHSYTADISKGIPNNLMGKHSLEAWGYRIGKLKSDFGKKTDWKVYTPEMRDYCIQDVKLNVALWKYFLIQQRNPPIVPLHWEIEHEFFKILDRQYADGMPFDTEACLEKIDQLKYDIRTVENTLKGKFGNFIDKQEFIPKVNNAKRGYKKGVPVIKVIETPFNPRSRQHIERLFGEKYGWEPAKHTDKGNPIVDADVLAGLEFPEAKGFLTLAEYDKELSKLEGTEKSLMANVRDGRCYGWAISNGAITGRVTHQIISNIPKGEFRKLFKAPPGYCFVGCDAKALELRVLSHYLFSYDQGHYVTLVTEGDVHTSNMRGMNLTDRNQAKSIIFAMIYGAGDAKLGALVDATASQAKQKQIGSDVRGNLYNKFPALKELTTAVKAAVDRRGFLKGIDGRLLYPRASYAALNTLVQSTGAILMKKANIIFIQDMEAAGYKWGEDYQQVLQYHDEIQLICKEEHADGISKIIAGCIGKAGKSLGIKCPMEGDTKRGPSWFESH